MYAGVVLAGLIWMVVRWRYGAAPWPKVPSFFRLPWLVPACAVTLLGLFIAQLWTIAFEAHHQIASSCYHHLPIPVVTPFEGGGGPAMPAAGAALAACAVLQAIALASMYLAAEQRSPNALERFVACVAFAGGVAAAIMSPAMTSGDSFLYFAYAKVGEAAFAAAPHAMSVPDFPLRSWCVDLLLPSAYGPAFVAYARGLLAAVHQPAVAIVVLRATNALWVLLAIALLRRLGVAASIVAAFALNPVVLFEYIANAHNDIIMICLILAAMTLDSPLPYASLMVVCAAGLFKLPFLAVGALAFAGRSSLRERLLPIAISVPLVLLVSYFWAGPGYFLGLQWYQRLLASTDRSVMALSLVAITAIGFALVRRAYAGAASFSIAGLATAFVQPWYLGWGMPYAVREKRHIAVFLALLPLGALLTDETISRHVQLVLLSLAYLVIVTLAMRDMRAGGGQSSRAAP